RPWRSYPGYIDSENRRQKAWPLVPCNGTWNVLSVFSMPERHGDNLPVLSMKVASCQSVCQGVRQPTRGRVPPTLPTCLTRWQCALDSITSCETLACAYESGGRSLPEPAGYVPEQDRGINASRGHGPAIGRKRDGSNTCGVPQETLDFLAGGYLPETN